ncbi:MAG: superoxide dismutase [Bacteroidetes bacterium]|nr:superoxide dismutase [Bacteroidota bacterium]
MAFKLPELGFDYDALEPYIDAQTMEIHHSKHHAGYLKKFNAAIEGTELEEMKPSDIFAEVSKYNDAVRNNGGGFFNHALFWKFLTPNAHENLDKDLADAITKYFGSLENLKEEFSNAAATQFGSGWAWLLKKDDGELVVTSSPNQDNPLMDIAPIKGTPILCIDVWEHAYYLKYQNKRPDYIQAFWKVVNWDKVAELYHK